MPKSNMILKDTLVMLHHDIEIEINKLAQAKIHKSIDILGATFNILGMQRIKA